MNLLPTDMKREDVYLVNTHRYLYRPGTPARIIGIDMCTPGDKSPRLCYHILYADGQDDWVPIKDKKLYKIITFRDILNGNVPSVTD